MYIILGIITILLVIIAIYKLRVPFWSKQPVFHFHNLRYWLFPPGIIQHKNPEKNKYYDPNIYFNSYRDTSSKKKNYLHFLLKKIIYLILKKSIIPPKWIF